MYERYFVAACILLFVVIAVQLIKLSVLSIRIVKEKSLYSAEIKEDKHWQFIKGLY